MKTKKPLPSEKTKIVNTLYGTEEMDIFRGRPVCIIQGCGSYANNKGNGFFGKLCTKHHQERYKMGINKYKQYRKDYCENVDGRLGFVCTTNIVWNGMLDTDHIDGHSDNNDPSNLQTLCKCCHAYKTRQNKDYLTPGRKSKKKQRESERESDPSAITPPLVTVGPLENFLV